MAEGPDRWPPGRPAEEPLPGLTGKKQIPILGIFYWKKIKQ
jgi:hypothetical protein